MLSRMLLLFLLVISVQVHSQESDESAESKSSNSSNEGDWLNGVGIQVLAPDSEADADSESDSVEDQAVTTDDASQPQTKVRLKWAKKYGVWGNYGFGYTTAGFKRASKDLVFGYDKLFFDALEMGLYARMSSLTYVDSVYFENTGYTEKRSYEISSLLLGPHIRYRLVGKLGLVVGGGVSLLQSKLKGVSTNAPLPSSLTIGETTTFPLDVGYDLGFYYRYKIGQFRVGAEAGYTINSLKPANAIGELYVGFHLEYYAREIVKEVVPATND